MKAKELDCTISLYDSAGVGGGVIESSILKWCMKRCMHRTKHIFTLNIVATIYILIIATSCASSWLSSFFLLTDWNSFIENKLFQMDI